MATLSKIMATLPTITDASISKGALFFKSTFTGEKIPSFAAETFKRYVPVSVTKTPTEDKIVGFSESGGKSATKKVKTGPSEISG